MRYRHRIHHRGSVSRKACAASPRPGRCRGYRGYARRCAPFARFRCPTRTRHACSTLCAPATPSAHRIGRVGTKRTGHFARPGRAVLPFASRRRHERDVDRGVQAAAAVWARPLRQPARAGFIRLRSDPGGGAAGYSRMGSDPGPACSRLLGLRALRKRARAVHPRQQSCECIAQRSPTALSERWIAAKITATWGCSSAGRASRSQCEGREFDPPQLHQHPPKGRSCRVFCFSQAALR